MRGKWTTADTVISVVIVLLALAYIGVAVCLYLHGGGGL